jgi:hypothetical protein
MKCSYGSKICPAVLCRARRYSVSQDLLATFFSGGNVCSPSIAKEKDDYEPGQYNWTVLPGTLDWTQSHVFYFQMAPPFDKPNYKKKAPWPTSHYFNMTVADSTTTATSTTTMVLAGPTASPVKDSPVQAVKSARKARMDLGLGLGLGLVFPLAIIILILLCRRKSKSSDHEANEPARKANVPVTKVNKPLAKPTPSSASEQSSNEPRAHTMVMSPEEAMDFVGRHMPVRSK